LHPLLANIQCVDTLEQALQKQSGLKAGETLITKEGVLLGSNWLKTPAKEAFNQQDGVLARKREIEETKAKIVEIETNVDAQQDTQEKGQQLRKELEEKQAILQARLNELHREESQAQSVIHANENRIKQTQVNQERVLSDIIDLESQQSNNQEFHQNATLLRNQALQLLENLETKKVEIEGKDAPLQEAVFKAKENARRINETVQQAQLKVETAKNSQHNAQQQLNRLDERLAMLSERKDTLITQNLEQSTENYSVIWMNH